MTSAVAQAPPLVRLAALLAGLGPDAAGVAPEKSNTNPARNVKTASTRGVSCSVS